MSDIANKLFEGLAVVKDAVQAVASRLKDIVPEIKAEASRLGTQGTMELASALFGGSGFVPYGPGQYTPTPEHAPESTPEPSLSRLAVAWSARPQCE